MTDREFTNPVIRGEPGSDHGDPFVIKYLDSFYLFHSGETAGRRGISVHRSADLVDWEFEGYALEPAESGWAWSDLWAPEVVYERGVFYMYVSATRKRLAGAPPTHWRQGEGDESGRRLGLARATSPLGPFTFDAEPLLDNWSIDAHPFRDDDGTMWLFYNVQTSDLGLADVLPGTAVVCDRLLGPDRLAGDPVPVALPSDPWEGVPTRDWYWNEAPYVLKRRDRYYATYSGGAFADESYAIGLVEAPAIRGPWQKSAVNPVVRGTTDIRGPGHVSFVFGPDVATPYALYHGYVGDESGRKVLLDRLRWAGDRPVISGPTAEPQPRPPEPLFDPAIPHWRAEAWVRGSWVEVGGIRLSIAPDDVWHQIEVVQADDRFAVRIGGVLRTSRPGFSARGGTIFATDGELRDKTVMSALDDGGLRALPAESSYVWKWGGRTPLDLSIAVRGAAELRLDGSVYQLAGGEDRFELTCLRHGTGVDEIELRALEDGVLATDLLVVARHPS